MPNVWQQQQDRPVAAESRQVATHGALDNFRIRLAVAHRSMKRFRHTVISFCHAVISIVRASDLLRCKTCLALPRARWRRRKDESCRAAQSVEDSLLSSHSSDYCSCCV